MNNIIHIIQHTARTATVLLLALLTAQTAGAEEGYLTDFVTVSSQGTATARFAYSDHFYRVDWSGINTDKTSSVQLFISIYNDIRYMINGNSGTDNLYASATESDKWRPSHITSLTPGQSSDGYTNFGNLATGAQSSNYPPTFKKVCTVTCLSASAPTWAWSADRSACTATFTCAEDASLTATVTATVTAAGGSITASATFNGTAYSDTKTDPWGRSDGRDGSEANPYAIGSPEALALLSDYVNAGNNASALHFEQTQDIDMSSAGNFTPIGSKANDYNPTPFRGTYDGKGHAITGLTVDTTSPMVGLFGYFEGTVRNVTMVNPNVKCSLSGFGSKYAGGIVGLNHYGTVENCNVINPTLNAQNKGAICGGFNSAGATVRNCYYYTTTNYNAVDTGSTVGTISNTSRAYTLTLASGITTSTAPAFTYGGTGYYAGTITLAAAPTGWNYAYSVNGSAIGGNTFDISADASVTVTRTPIDYTITYNLGGGTNASGNPATYTIQSPAITLAAPTRTGYTFGGWYANSGLTGNQVTTIASGSTGNVELWAKWTPTQYTINYNLGGGTNHGDNPTTYTVESAAIALGAATRTGYQFGGWYASADCSGDAVTTIGSGQTGDVELWAKWTANRYAISFVGNGKTGGTMDNELFTYDEAKALTACAYTRTGYHFTGWNTEADGSGTAYADGQEVLNLTAEPDATLTLYAQWTANTYTVHFVAGIPVNGTMADMTLTYDQEATALTKNAFSTTTGQWLRWNTEADGKGTDYEDEALVQNLTAEDGGVVTLYAQWRLQHRFNYDNSIFRCYNTSNTNEVYWAYAGEKVKVEVIDGTSEYTIRVVNGDDEAITLNTKTNTFVMPDEEVWITYTSVKKMSYTTISLDNFESGDDVAYLYDASQPTVTPTVVVKDGETVLTEGTDYTLAITNNTGSATQMVTATVTVTGMGGYVGTNTREFRITPFNIANCEIKGMEAYDDGYGVYYPLERNVEVWNGETKLVVGTDYSLDVEYADSYVVGQFYNATVKGTGDWGGSQTFQFKVVELHHTVVFVANGGSGTMASDVATKGQLYTLPACGFTAPDGKKFSHWVASCEPDAEKQPGDYFTAPYIWNESYVQTITVTAYWRDKATFTVTLPEEMEVVSGTLTDGKAIEDEVITFRPRPGFTATDVQANGTALTPDGEGIYTLTVTADVTVTATFRSSTIDLTDASGDFAAINNDVLTGTTSHTVTIANGASITLNNVAISGGIVCEGTAEITLVGTNSVSGATNKAGIQIGGSGTTLTIKGDGSLTANGGDNSAGIGLSRAWKPANDVIGGDIVIEGGNITANGGSQWGAGIGTGVIYAGGGALTARIGNITIKGGTVKATGGSDSDGIGTGYTYYGCTNAIGTVTIYDGIDKVDASSIKNFGSVVYMHGENNVTASKTDYFTIIEDGDRRIIEKKDDTDYTITIADDIEHGTLTGAATAKYGEKVTITVTPDFGYRLSRFVVKDADNNDVPSTGNTFQMPKGNVTVSAVFEQGTHGTTEFAWGYFGSDDFVTEATIYDGLTTVNLQQGQSCQILEYDENDDYRVFLLDNSTYEATIPYSGGTGTFPEYGNGTNFNLNDESGFYDITMTDVGNDKWSVSILKTVGVIDNIPDQTYTGSEITPEPLVLAGSLSLTKGTDYEYSYTNNTNVGTATVRATFQGTYASLGYVERTFTILPPPVVVVNVTGNGTVTYNDKSAASGETIGVTAEKGTDVTLTLTPGNGYAVRSVEYGYTKSNETTMNGAKLPINGTTATLTVPNDLKDGTYVNLTVTFVSALVGGADEASAVALTDNTLTDLAGGWYKVDSDITFDHTLSLLNETYLTIAEDKTMTVNTASNRGIYSDYTLFVSGDGALSVTTTAGYGIAVLVGNYVQTGATVTASGYIGIRCTDDFIAFNFDNDFTFSSGQLTATGSGGDGIWANNTITLGWTNPADRITASSYNARGTVKVADGQALTDGSGHIYSGTLDAADLAAIGGQTLQPALLLADNADNTAAITAHAGKTLAVALSGRTLYKDGSWNTLCLPFAVSTASGTLSDDGVKAMTLNTTTSSLADGTLTLNFDDAKGQTIPAGTPFIIKWNNTGVNIENPVFEDVTVSKATNDATVDGVLTFTGTYAPVKIADGGDNTKLYLGSGNKLYYPNAAMTIGCQRAYFQLAAGITAGNSAGGNEHGNDVEDGVRAFVLNFGDDEANGILSVSAESSREALPAAWYTLDGRRLDGQPTAKGLYIHGGKKVIVK